MKAHKVEKKNMSSTEERVAILETMMMHFDHALIDLKHDIRFMNDRMESSFNSLNAKIDNRFDILDKKTEGVQNRLWFTVFWMIGGFAVVLGVVAHALNWI